MSKGRILVVEDKEDWRSDLEETLRDEGYTVDSVDNFRAARQILKSSFYPVITVDLNLEEGVDDPTRQMKKDGELILRYVKENHPDTRCIVVSGSINSKREMRDLLKQRGAFDCFSKQEFDWEIFLQSVEEAMKQGKTEHEPEENRPVVPEKVGTVRIFISYKHHDYDEQIMKELVAFIEKEVERAGGEIWTDKQIRVGDYWDTAIRQELARTQIALVLVSQDYLNSPYITDVELSSFITDRRRKGLLIFPIILSSCLWQNYPWLAETQFLPTDGTLDYEYADRGKRNRLYTEIARQLVERIKEIRQA